MKVVIPRAIDVGGVTYRILCNQDKELRRNGNNGEHRWSDLEIAVNMDCKPDRRACSFLHETLHAIDAEYNDGKGMSEETVDATASGLMQVLKQMGIEFVLEGNSESTGND